MNRIKILTLSMLAMALVFSSCSKDDDDDIIDTSGPSLTVTPTEVSAWVGDAISIEYTISTASANEITSLEISTSETELSPVSLSEDDLDDNLATGSYDFAMPEGPAGAMWEDGDFFTVTFVATHEVDNVSYTSTKSVTCTYVAPMDPLTEYTGAMINNLIGPSTGAWDLMMNQSVSSSESDALKDMRNTTTLSSSAPEIFETEWDSPAGSTFVLTALAAADYDVITPDDLVSEYAAGTAVSVVSDVQEGQVYIAELRGTGAYAAILITEVNVTADAGDNNDFIGFTYKKL